MTFGIFISTIVLIYVLGVFVALRIFDRAPDPDTELPEAQRAAVRARAGVLWPVRFTGRVLALVARQTPVPAQQGMDVHADLHM